MYIYIRLLCNTLVIHFCIHIYYAIHNIDFGRLVCLVFPSPIFIDPQTKNPWGFTEPFRIIQENFTNNAILSFSTTNCGKTVNKNLNLKKKHISEWSFDSFDSSYDFPTFSKASPLSSPENLLSAPTIRSLRSPNSITIMPGLRGELMGFIWQMIWGYFRPDVLHHWKTHNIYILYIYMILYVCFGGQRRHHFLFP